MDQEGTSMTTAVVELGEGVKLVVRWNDGTWYMDLKVRDFYLLQDRELIGLEWTQMKGAVRLALMTSRNYLTNLAARLVSSAASAANILEDSAEGEIILSVKGEENDL
jgi:hypothetical protein